MLVMLLALSLQAADTAAYTALQCPDCAEWNQPIEPVRLFGNTYYVGTRGLTALLITSDRGHVLLDGGLPSTAPLIMRSIRALGFRVEDVRIIGNSHVHYDHAGGIAALQRASRAEVVALARAAPALSSGTAAPDDPQHDIHLDFPRVQRVRTIGDGDTVRLGPLRLTAHATEGHAPGGTTWTWESCDGGRCVQFVYGDSQTPVSSPGFRFTGSPALEDFERGFRVLESIRCDVLLTPHPGASNLLARMNPSNQSLIDTGGCRRYAATARARLARRVEEEARPDR